MTRMKQLLLAGVVVTLAMTGLALGQKDNDEDIGPTALLNFHVLKDDNGKPVRNAAVVMHAISPQGKEEKGGMELKTDLDGKAEYDGVPFGKLRVQVLASGFQTYGEDFDINKAKMDFTIKLKRPKQQFSIYEDRPKDSNPPPGPKQEQKKPD